MQALVSEKGVVMCDFVDRSEIAREMSGLMRLLPGCRVVDGGHVYLDRLRAELEEYFEGRRKEFQIPLHLVGTSFQVRVWQALLQIPYGTTITYAQQARMIGNPAAVRAVASANGRNRLPILVPCHRVIGAGGNLTGYAGGLRRKFRLLALEGFDMSEFRAPRPRGGSDLRRIPGVGANIEEDLFRIGIRSVADLAGEDPEQLYRDDCAVKKFQEDRCQLYVFRLAVYFAEHPHPEPEKLRWHWWKDHRQ